MSPSGSDDPHAATRVHVVRPGDTVWAIAGGRPACVRAILAASGVEDARRIQPGARLAIPEDGCPATLAAQPARAPATAPKPRARRIVPTDPAPAAGGVESVAAGESAPPPERGPSPDAVAKAVDRAEAELRAARFEEALAGARATHELARALGAPAADEVLRACLVEVTVHVALADRPSARRSLARALEIDPALVLDPRSTSPKVLAVLEAERTRREVRIARGPGAR